MTIMERPDERRALEILKAAFPEKYSQAVLLDKPDIQNPEENIGVEVTQALKESVLKVLGLNEKLIQNEQDIKAAIEDKYGKEFLSVSLPLPDNEMKKVTISVANWHNLFNLYQAYDNKLMKLRHGNYTLYAENNLFIYVFSEDELAIERLMRHIGREKTGTYYDNVYVYSQPVLFVIDCERLIVEKLVPIVK